MNEGIINYLAIHLLPMHLAYIGYRYQLDINVEDWKILTESKYAFTRMHASFSAVTVWLLIKLKAAASYTVTSWNLHCSNEKC
jgi:hypothetical protein